MSSDSTLARHVKDLLGSRLLTVHESGLGLTVELDRRELVESCTLLKDDANTKFEQLIDLCGVDYSAYGKEEIARSWKGERYAVVYHLLSVSLNQRIRLRVQLDDSAPVVQSVTSVWPCADWFEREAFDLFGIIFDGHPDLRRILTDYGFIGHPFRKDFPLSGYVEMRYDPDKGRVVYEPVSIEPRTLVPRVIREDSFANRDS